jgi:hypothetical protein
MHKLFKGALQAYFLHVPWVQDVEKDWVRGLAQRATEPYFPQRSAKGTFVVGSALMHLMYTVHAVCRVHIHFHDTLSFHARLHSVARLLAAVCEASFQDWPPLLCQ